MSTAPAAATEHPPRVRVPLQGFVNGAGAMCIVVGALVLFGWAQDIGLLKSLLPGHAEMKANTALCMVCAGLALMTSRAAGPPGTTISLALSAFLLGLGALTLLEYGSGADVGIDTMLFDDPRSLLEGRAPGRMSQISAFAFVLIGWKGMEARGDARVWLGQTLALAVMAIGVFALSAYGWAMGMGSREAPFNPISVHTAILLLLLGMGWLAAQPQAGVMRVLSAASFGGELARRTLLPALLIPPMLSYGAQLLRGNHVLSDGAIITLLAVSSGIAVSAMIWWASALLDRVETQRRVAHQLRDSANRDALTGLGNRRAFDEALRHLLSAHAGGGPVFSLLLLDLDHFKSYNDSFGHPAGDEALRQAGMLLGISLRPGDIACRYGGEEFALLLPGADAAGAMRAAQRVVKDMRGGLWTHRPVTASVGGATVRAGDDGNSLVTRADAALYAAKRAGRDRAQFQTGE